MDSTIAKESNNHYMSILDILPDNHQYLTADGSPDYQKLFDALPLEPMDNDVPYAMKLPNSQQDGFSSIYRSVLSPNALINTIHPDLDTGFKMFENACDLFGDLDALGKRLYNEDCAKFDDFFTYESYNQLRKRRNNLASGIKNLFPNDLDFIVSIFSPNRPEWLLTQYASMAHSLPITALYDTLGPNTTKFILNFTKSPILFCPLNKINNIINLISNSNNNDNIPNLKFIISMDPINDFELNFGLIQFAKLKIPNLTIMSIHQLESIGELNPLPFNPPNPNSLFAISFTSGTTGDPKGVVLTHENLVSALSSCLTLINKPNNLLNKNDQIQGYCFLPLAHIYELLTSNLAISRGTKLAFPNDPSNPSNLVENLKLSKPHYINFVPRVYNKFETVLKQGLNSTIKGQLILKILLLNNNNNNHIPNFLREKLQSLTRSLLGLDRTNFAVTGSAPINPSTVEFLTKILGIRFKLGYGLTESFAGTSISSIKDLNFETCGGIFPSTEVKLKDVPDMGYLTIDEKTGKKLNEPKGEILLRGPQIFHGYYKNSKATNEVLDNDGWFKTGDVGHIDKFGRLFVIDRVKNFFKLSQGEYVSPEKIENIYMSECADFITQIFITGKSVERYLVGIVGIDPIPFIKKFKDHEFKTSLETNNDSTSNIEGLISQINSSIKLKKKLLNKMNSKIKELQGFEKIHNLIVLIEPLKIQDDTITPTMKIKRSIASKFFQEQIDEMYQQGDLVRSEKI